ncbi:MAG: L,D-transpeptidase [Heliobacteriaceae bacterium]|nr:L,D-transpeptidase [Heliobacteriaceae bacterium]MDD4587629.1 L,D-transpeptidase [Heliobacteriaceae bacterium]
MPAGTFIKLTLPLFRLELFQHSQVRYSFPVGTGKPQTPTPTGNFEIITKYILDGKGVLGSRWLGFDAPNGPYGIHGTNFPAGIGRQVSNGCVRMHNRDVETLFPIISIGTTVYIVS